MRQKLVLGVAGLVVWGVGLTGCQSTPQRTPMASTSRPLSQTTASGQTSQNWNTSTAAAQGSSISTAGTKTTSATTPAGGTTFNVDPNAFPRTSQDAMPRQIGNQTSSYTTMPNNVSDLNASSRATSATMGGGQGTTSMPAASTTQRAGSGFTQTGFATSTPPGQPTNPYNASSGTTIPGREEFATTAPATGAMGSMPPSSSGSGMPTLPSAPTPRSIAPSSSGSLGRAPADEFPPQPDLRGPQAGPQIPLPPQ